MPRKFDETIPLACLGCNRQVHDVVGLKVGIASGEIGEFRRRLPLESLENILRSQLPTARPQPHKQELMISARMSDDSRLYSSMARSSMAHLVLIRVTTCARKSHMFKAQSPWALHWVPRDTAIRSTCGRHHSPVYQSLVPQTCSRAPHEQV